MLNVDRVLRFPTNHKRRPVKATLSKDTHPGVAHIQTLAPILGRTNPENVPVVERIMQNFIDYAPPRDGEGGHKQAGSPAEDDLWYVAPIDAQRRYAVRCRQIGEEIQRNTHRNLIALLRDMAGPTPAA
jgi:hypothetical protein